MKLKKNISKFLILSILLNNIYFYSNAASNDNLSRYETLEGEFIDLGDIDSKDVSEIEIFGNTVQDPDNLEDIQSVGDLYVDEEGEPILDSEGREQYKIEIESININLLDLNKNPFIDGMTYNYATGEKMWRNYVTTSDMIPVLPNTNYQYHCFLENMSIVDEVIFYFFDKNKKYIRRSLGDVSDGTGGFTTPLKTKFVSITLSSKNNTYLNGNKMYLTFGTGNYTGNYTPHQSNKTTILLPCQLMKIGNIADRLYWDNNKNKYIIEKNVEVFSITDLNIPNSPSIGQNNARIDLLIKTNIGMPNTKDGVNKYVLAKNLKSVSYYVPDRDSIDCQYSFNNDAGGPWFGLVLPKEFNTNTLFIEELKRLDVEFYMALKIPQIIETNITQKIQLKTYSDKTYISTASKNGINPTLKIYIDKLEETSQEAVDNAIATPTSSNIALARMFVNMLPESLYKDQLQAKLNEIFSEDVVLDKQSATANLDIYIKSENILMMSLDTNTVTFEDYSGVEELELQNAINISINSSLPYSLNAYIVGDITNKEKDKTLDLDVLNIRDGSEVEYKKFDSINNKLILQDNCNKGNDISHSIDLKLSGNKAHDADVYKTTLKFEVEQK